MSLLHSNHKLRNRTYQMQQYRLQEEGSRWNDDKGADRVSKISATMYGQLKEKKKKENDTK